MRRVNRAVSALAAACVCLAVSAAGAETWPTRHVKMIVAGAAGSAPDVICRIVGDRLARKWGRQIMVDNQPGAGGNRGTGLAARATPDGYTFLFGQAAPLALNKHIYKELPFDVQRDFDPVILVGLSPMMIATSAKSRLGTIPDLLAAAKAAPGKLSFATSSVKNIPHSTGELLKSMGGIDLLHVSYRANQQALTDTMTGLVDLMIDGVPVIIPQVKGGSLKVIGVTSPRRLPGLEDIPAVAETLPGFSVAGWFAILAPRGTPPEIIARVNQDTKAVLAIPEVVARLRDLGVYPDPANTTPEQLAAFMKAEEEVFGRIATAAHMEKE